MTKSLILFLSLVVLACHQKPVQIPNRALFVAHVLDEMGDSHNAKKIYLNQQKASNSKVQHFAAKSLQNIDKRKSKAKAEIDQLKLSIQFTQFPQGNFRRFYKLALLHEVAGDDAKALEYYNISLKLRKKQSSVFLRQALIYERKINHQLAQKLFTKAMMLKGQDPHILFHQAMYQIRTGNPKVAIKTGKRLNQKWPRLYRAIQEAAQGKV